MEKIEGKASIVIRSKNEEEWISHCLGAVFEQQSVTFEVILVDNNSSDYTLKIARQFPIKKIVSIKHYLPGKALNKGINETDGDYIVCLSSHCVPLNNLWLYSLLKNFENPDVVGVYGRQIPLSFSSPYDARDLFITFGLDRRIQLKDTFFHNANSAILKKIWNDIPFDNDVTNIEDRLWAKAVIDKGFQLIYEPEAEVFHHHGIHQTQKLSRVNSTFQILNTIPEFKIENKLPETMRPENRTIFALVPIQEHLPEISNFSLLESLLTSIQSSKLISKTFVFANIYYKETIEKYGFHFIERNPYNNELNKGLEDMLKWLLLQIESVHGYPSIVLYINPLYPFRPKKFFDNILSEHCYKGLDSTFASFIDYQNYWSFDEEKGYRLIGEGFLPRNQKHPIYKSIFGMGCASNSKIIRSGKLIGKKVGILTINDIKMTLKASELKSLELIKLIINAKRDDYET